MENKWAKEKVIERILYLHKTLKRRPVKRDESGLYSASRKMFGTWNNAMKAAGFEIKKLQKPIIPNKLTPELLYLLGLLITDGHIAKTKKKKYKILLFTSYKEELDLILELIRKIFAYNAFVREKKYGFNKRTNYEIHICSKELVYYFKNTFGIPSGAKSKTVVIPKIIFKINKSNKVSFIRGVIDGDGTVTAKRAISVSSGSKKFLIGFKRLLSQVEIQTGKIKWHGTVYNLPLFQREGLKAYNLIYRSAAHYYPRKREILQNKYI